MIETGDLRIDKIMPKLSSRWPLIGFEDCLLKEQFKITKLKKKEIKPTGRIPVIDQGEKFISGYIDDDSKRYDGSLPVIIFGDHTRRVKFVDFQFAVGADGTKILRPDNFLNDRFFYYYLSIKIP